MNEQTERYVKLLKKHLDRVVIAILYLFLFALIGIWYMEQAGGEEVSESETIARIPDPIEENPFWKSIQTMSEPQKIEAYPGIQQIRQYNMFDYKSVKQQEDLLRAVNQKYAQAQDAEKAGRKEEAVRLLNEVLQQKPNHEPAKNLLKKLEPPKPKEGEGDAPAPEGNPPA